MIEKYGADPTTIPYANEQYAEIKKMASEMGVDMPEFKTQREAQAIIDEMQKQMGVK